ncbi:MAG: hypothetical protein BGO95_11030 [Micrococcales bacterium 73-13]|nr:MAG: hypothetical protein BGO95_11030 [Micrococcales bacterium 73-13]
MNKNAKGAIAVGAAVLLLLGGGGTFALWNTSSTLNAGSIDTGHLTASSFTGGWKDQNGDAFAPGTDFAVPGDVLTYTATSDIDAEGTNLRFTAFIDPASITSALSAGWTLVPGTTDVSIANVTGTFTTAAALGADYNPSGLPTDIDVISLTSPAATGTLTYTFQIAFGSNSTPGGDNAHHDSTSALNGLTMTVQQVFAH